MRILSSNVTSISQLTLKNCTEGLYVLSSTIQNLEDSTFEHNGAETKINGGAIHMVDSDVVVQNTTFTKNTAQDGGAISFQCSSLTLCGLDIPSSTFQDNRAIQRGGAVYYNYGRPEFGDEIIYTNNSAQYGENIASYAVKITFAESSTANLHLSGLGPGIAHDETLQFAVRDYDDQIMVLDSQNQVSITSDDSALAQVTGFNVQPLVNGVASFDNFVVNSDPGSSGIMLTASTKSIDQPLVSTVFGSQISDNSISVDFRFCQPGEQILNGICSVCSAGTYSFDWNSTECTQCMDDAVCDGGVQISVNPGYWRATSNSTSIIECINKDACDGGYSEASNDPTN